MRQLFIFDIDGTLIHGGPLWNRSFKQAVREVAPEAEQFLHSFNGKTDGQICMEALVKAYPKRSREESERMTHEIHRRYLALAEQGRAEMGHLVQVLPGVEELLHALKGSQISLLTGNLRRGAELKLECGKIAHHFDFNVGVFSDDHWDRYEMPAIAAEKAHVQTTQITVIGDTIHDVGCGKRHGCRTVAVGTGRNVDQDELQAAQPDHYFADFSDTRAILKILRQSHRSSRSDPGSRD